MASDDVSENTLPRRRFLVSLAVTGSGVLLCKDLLFAGQSAGPTTATGGGETAAAINPFAFHLELRADGAIVITSPQTEIGQGIADTLAMVIADEMDADWSRVTVALAHANLAFANPVTKRQRIGGSDSVMAYREPLRQVGAAQNLTKTGLIRAFDQGS